MPKLEVKSSELVGTDVDFVALVKRGANQIPFRITKEDTEPMLDLTRLSSAFFKKADPVLGVFAAVVRKGADLDAIKKALTDAGLSVENAEETEEAIIFKQDGVSEHELGNVKINEDVGLVIAGLNKAFCGWDFEATTFGEMHKTNSFYPSMRTALDTYSETVYNIMQKADTPAEAADALSKAADELKQYVSALAGALPERAFKAEVELNKSDMGKKKKKPEAGEEMDETKKTTGGSDGPGFGQPAKSPQNTPKDKTKEEEEEGKSNTNTDGLPSKAKKDGEGEGEDAPQPSDNAALLKSLSELIDNKLSAVTNSVNTIKGDLEGVQKKLGEVSERAKKAEEAVNGTVNSEPGGERQSTRKSDRVSKGAPPLLDTGFDNINAA